MRFAIGLFLLSSLIFSCNTGNSIPDVSKLNIPLKTDRFEQLLFGLDKANFSDGMQKIKTQYPAFANNFIFIILGADPKWSNDSINNYVKKFTIDYKSIYDTSALLYTNFLSYENEIKKGLQFVKHYFPNYKIPNKIITYLGPLDGYGDILADSTIIVGLHLHLGKNFSLYKTELVQQIYPEYLSTRFEPDYISVNCLKNIVLDLFPEKIEDKTLVQQMIEKGKRLYVLSKILPYTTENKYIGYTKTQMQDCYTHEKNIWNLFIQNNTLQSIDENIIKNYIGEMPKTAELGDDAPGNIGSFVGWQIVKKYMQINTETGLQKLMDTDNDTILAKAKYKP